MPDATDPATQTLMVLLSEKRAQLVRFFAVRTSSSEEAEDVVQDMFLKLAGRQPGPVENPISYIFKLGTNIMLDRFRAKRRSAVRDDAYYQTRRTVPAGSEDETDEPSPELGGLWSPEVTAADCDGTRSPTEMPQGVRVAQAGRPQLWGDCPPAWFVKKQYREAHDHSPQTACDRRHVIVDQSCWSDFEAAAFSRHCAANGQRRRILRSEKAGIGLR